MATAIVLRALQADSTTLAVDAKITRGYRLPATHVIHLRNVTSL